MSHHMQHLGYRLFIYLIFTFTYLFGCTSCRRRRWQPTAVLLPGKSHGGGAWWAAVHEVAKSQTRLSDFTFTFHFHALEKEMATHTSVLAWKIPGTGKPGGQPSMGSHRVGHDWSDLTATVTATAGLSCSMQDLVPWPGIEPGPGALGAWSLSHWTTREVPEVEI